jgi:hypothetical protein
LIRGARRSASISPDAILIRSAGRTVDLMTALSWKRTTSSAPTEPAFFIPGLHNKKAARWAAFAFEVESGRRRLALGFDRGLFALHVGVGAFPFDGLISLLSHISLYFAYVLRFRGVTMVIRLVRFNLYLLLAATACWRHRLPIARNQGQETKGHPPHPSRNQPAATPGKANVLNVLRSRPHGSSASKNPVPQRSEHCRCPRARNPMGFIVIQFEPARTMTCSNNTPPPIPAAAYAIRTQFRQSTNVFDRWIAAPLDHRSDQQRHPVNFTPDADQHRSRGSSSRLEQCCHRLQSKKRRNPAQDQKKSEACCSP